MGKSGHPRVYRFPRSNVFQCLVAASCPATAGFVGDAQDFSRQTFGTALDDGVTRENSGVSATIEQALSPSALSIQHSDPTFSDASHRQSLIHRGSGQSSASISEILGFCRSPIAMGYGAKTDRVTELRSVFAIAQFVS